MSRSSGTRSALLISHLRPRGGGDGVGEIPEDVADAGDRPLGGQAADEWTVGIRAGEPIAHRVVHGMDLLEGEM